MPNLITTIGHIKSFNPCQDGIDKLISSIPGYTYDTEVLDLGYILDNNGVEDTMWVLRCWDYKKYCLLCADIAETVLYIFEDKYPNDLRPRKSIEAIRKYHRGEITKQHLNVNTVAAAVAAATIAAVAVVAAAAAVVTADTYSVDVIAAKKEQWNKIEQLLIKFIQEK